MRARNIKPGYFNNEELAECSALSRLLFIGTWMAADREGRFEDRPKRLKMQLFPMDDISVDDALQELADHGFIIRYEHDGARYVQIKNFLKHQNPHYKEPPSVIPPPPGWVDSGYVATGVPESKRQAIFDRDGRACLQCGATDQLSLDHIIPRSKGGTDDDDNLQTLCRSCNSAKNNRQASADLKTSSANDRPMIDQPSEDDQAISEDIRCQNRADSLIPDTGFSDTGIQISESRSLAERERAPARVRPAPKPKREYPQNPTWNALSAACGAPDTRDEKSDFALTVQQLDEVNATPDEIAGFPPWWRENYGDIRLTHRCYRKHFGGYRNEPPKPPPQISDIKNPRIRAALTTDVSDIYAKHEAERAERNGLPGQMDYPRLSATTRRIGS